MKSHCIFYWIFFLSGATGLVYQVIWVRLTGLSSVTPRMPFRPCSGLFMAGLALGSWILGKVADRTPRPLRMYGILEIGIGLTAALAPFLFRSLQSIYWSMAPTLTAVPGADSFVRFFTSFLVLLAPTFLMGGTLPMLTRFFTQSIEEVQRKVGVLYALNTFGAAAGTLAASLFLIPYVGNVQTTIYIATINILIGVLVIWPDARGTVPAALAGEHAGLSPLEDPAPLETPKPSNPVIDRLVLLTLAVSGFVSMLYEVAWTRALTAIIGSSTYAFSMMLLTFLVGIALGSSLVGRLKPKASIRTLGMVQLGIAVGGVIFLTGYIVAPYIVISLIRALSYSFPAVLTTQFLMSAALMILATLGMGASFPIASQIYSSKYVILGRSIGNIYSVNTVGAIIGSLLAGFVFLPLIGTERTILIGLFFSSAISLLLLSEQPAGRSWARWVSTALLLVATLSMGGGIFWKPDMLDAESSFTRVNLMCGPS